MKIQKIEKLCGSVAILFLVLGGSLEVRLVDANTIQANQSVGIAVFDAPNVGIDFWKPFNLALTQQGGTILGHKIQIITNPDQLGCNLDNYFNRIRDPRVQALIGPACSFDVWPHLEGLFPIFHTKPLGNYLVISPSNSFHWLTDPVFRAANYFRNTSPDSDQGYVAATYAWNVTHANRVAMLFRGTDENGGSTDHEIPTLFAYGDVWFQEGGTFELIEDYPGENLNNTLVALNAEIEECEAVNGCKLVIFASGLFSEEIGFLYTEFVKENDRVSLIATDPAAIDFDFSIVEPGSVPRLNIVFDDGTGPNFQSFKDEFMNTFGEDPSHYDAKAFDATMLALMAIENTAVILPDGRLIISVEKMINFLNGNDPKVNPFNPFYCGAGGKYTKPVNGDLNLRAFDVIVPVVPVIGEPHFELVYLNDNNNC